MSVLWFLLLIPAFAIFDRWCGGGMGWRSTFKGRPLYYVALLIPAAFFLSWQVGVILLGWCLWRWPAWKLLGGSLAPKNWVETRGTFYRHLLILPVAFATLWAPAALQVCTVVILILWAMAATQLAVINRSHSLEGRDVNNYIELIRGAGFGLVAFDIMSLSKLMNV